MNDFLKPKIKELAKEHNLTQSQIIDIFYSQFRYVSKTMCGDQKKDFTERRSIKIKGIGTFDYKIKKAEIITKIKKEYDARKNLAQSSPEDGEGARIN